MKFELSAHTFEKYSYIKFHEDPSSSSSVFPCGQTDMRKIGAAFRNFANAPKILNICSPFFVCVLFEIALRASHDVILTNFTRSFFLTVLTGASKAPVLAKTCFTN